MRATLIAATGALVVAVVAIWGTSAINANSRTAAAVSAPAPFSVMQMMRDAKNLPVESFDAF